MSSEYAVLIPWVKTEDSEHLLMEVRSQAVRQPGEVCFPGGRVEAGETPEETAVRETCEELGLAAGDISIISEAEPYTMGDGRKVWSVHGRIEAELLDGLRISEAEVAEVFLLPVIWIRDTQPERLDIGIDAGHELPDKLHRYVEHYGEHLRKGETLYWEYGEYGIWGLTAKIIDNQIRQKE